MIEKSGSFKNKTGQTVYSKTWLPEIESKANIILVHGIGEHCSRYQHIASFLTEKGFSVYGFDHIGHGKSDGTRGAMRYENGYEIINLIKNKLISESPKVPIFIYGHSMGGAIVLAYGYQFPENVAGIIATSPGLGMANEMSPTTVSFLRILQKIVPNFTIKNGLPLEGLSHDKEVITAYQNDPLVHDRVSLSLGLDLIDTGKRLRTEKKPYPVPLLLVQGTEDKMVNSKATDEFASGLIGDVTYKRFEGGYHELHNDLVKQELFELIASWINQKI